MPPPRRLALCALLLALAPPLAARPAAAGPRLPAGALVAHPTGSRAADVAAVRATPWGRHERARRARRLADAGTRCVTGGATPTQAGPARAKGCGGARPARR